MTHVSIRNGSLTNKNVQMNKIAWNKNDHKTYGTPSKMLEFVERVHAFLKYILQCALSHKEWHHEEAGEKNTHSQFSGARRALVYRSPVLVIRNDLIEIMLFRSLSINHIGVIFGPVQIVLSARSGWSRTAFSDGW